MKTYTRNGFPPVVPPTANAAPTAALARYFHDGRFDFVFLKLGYCCGPECCTRALRHIGTTVESSAEIVNGINQHLDRCVSRFSKGVGMLNIMRSEMRQPLRNDSTIRLMVDK